MKFGILSSSILAMGSMLVFALPAAAQQVAEQNTCSSSGGVADGAFSGIKHEALLPPCSEPSLPPSRVVPLKSKKPSEFAEPAKPPLKPDEKVASTLLGFQQGVAPAPGRTLRYHGNKYLVVDVQADGGGPTFAGGSPFVIGISGTKLTVGLKSIVPGSELDPDRLDVTVVN